MNKKHQAVVTSLCVAATLALYTFLNNFLAPVIKGTIWGAPILSGIASIGFYLSFFKLVIWIYCNHVEDLVFKRASIKGDWFYILNINGQDVPRYGKCVVEKTSDGLTLSGIHYHPQRREFTSMFSSLSIDIDSPEVLIRYLARGIRRQELDSTQGMFFLQAEGVPPRKIHGLWSDVLPARNTGSITLMRITDEVKDQMKRVGYPEGMSESEIVFNARETRT